MVKKARIDSILFAVIIMFSSLLCLFSVTLRVRSLLCVYATLLLSSTPHPILGFFNFSLVVLGGEKGEGGENIDLSLVPLRRGLTRGFIQNTTSRARSFVDINMYSMRNDAAKENTRVYSQVNSTIHKLYKTVPNLSSHHLLTGKCAIDRFLSYWVRPSNWKIFRRKHRRIKLYEC